MKIKPVGGRKYQLSFFKGFNPLIIKVREAVPAQPINLQPCLLTLISQQVTSLT